ncbi:hypothetical protein NVS89_11230 [Ancylobacter sp. MQZ15Z-1]|uniref:EthD domain-containing protein n=1 Tax=Ancylobacter mangrovi TaxID=2972472 RepID=A0A9X2PBD7_9HYPH|nr:DUF4286 family protein [Ancylobacter mangrovi]MCS0495672.1 hypothetical protein [Ancylobacter mangrovi]
MSKKGFLLVLMQPPPAFEEEFNAWYDTEHVPDRLAVDGFESGRRYVCLDGHPKYLAMYDMENEAVLETEAYRRVSGERASPWTKRVTGRVSVYRSIGEQLYPGGELTRPTPRSVLMRFSGTPDGLADAVVAGARATFEGRVNTLQLRVFAYHRDGVVDFLVLAGLKVPEEIALDMGAFGEAAGHLDMVNSYALY